MTLALQKTDGGITYLSHQRAGETLVALHGIGSNATSFQPLFDRLPARFNMIAWNAPGYLGSDPVETSWPLPSNYAQTLVRFLDDLGLEKVHLLGHSLGTLIAASFARHVPDRLSSLTLASAAQGYRMAQRGKLPPKVAARSEDLDRLGPTAFAKARAANLVHDPEHNRAVVTQVETAMAAVNPKGYAQAVRLLASGDLSSDLAHVPMRPSFIIGAKDKVTPLAQTQTAAEAWQKAHGKAPHIKQIAKAGHAVYVQQPDAFCAALTAHLPAPADTSEDA